MREIYNLKRLFMGWFLDTVRSSLGKKLLMAITGLGLTLFLLSHLVGNLFLFMNDGGETFNTYAHNFKGNPLIVVFEVVIFAGFIVHIIDGIALILENKKARPVKYAYSKSPNKKVSWTSRKMSYLGLLLLIFLILHLSNFFAKSKIYDSGDIGMVTYGDVEMHDLFSYVKLEFSLWWYTAIYVICMIGLALHLAHGFQSAFQTIGWNHPKWSPIVKSIGSFIAFVIPAIFASMPIYFYVKSIL